MILMIIIIIIMTRMLMMMMMLLLVMLGASPVTKMSFRGLEKNVMITKKDIIIS